MLGKESWFNYFLSFTLTLPAIDRMAENRMHYAVVYGNLLYCYTCACWSDKPDLTMQRLLYAVLSGSDKTDLTMQVLSYTVLSGSTMQMLSYTVPSRSISVRQPLSFPHCCKTQYCCGILELWACIHYSWEMASVIHVFKSWQIRAGRLQ